MLRGKGRENFYVRVGISGLQSPSKRDDSDMKYKAIFSHSGVYFTKAAQNLLLSILADTGILHGFFRFSTIVTKENNLRYFLLAHLGPAIQN